MASTGQWNLSLPAFCSLCFSTGEDPGLPRWIQSPSSHWERLTQCFGGHAKREGHCSLQRPQIVNRLTSLTVVLMKGHNPRVPDEPFEPNAQLTSFPPQPHYILWISLKERKKKKTPMDLLSFLLVHLLAFLPPVNTLLVVTGFKKCYKQNW